jgi:hypothetical protein
LFNEIKAILKESLNETETALKKTPQKASNHKHSCERFDCPCNFIHRFCFTLHPHRVAGVPHDFHASLESLVHHRHLFRRYWCTDSFSASLNHKETIEIFQTPNYLETRENSIVEGTTVTKGAKIEKVDAEIDEISQRILLELQSASSTDLSDARYAKMMLRLSDAHYAKGVLQKIGGSKSGAENELEKRAVIKVLLFSTWLQRLYFIIRSFLMGLISAAVTYLIIWYLGSINVIGSIIIGTFVFVFSLAVTRLFDTQITQATKKIVELMTSHRAIRDFIMKHF